MRFVAILIGVIFLFGCSAVQKCDSVLFNGCFDCLCDFSGSAKGKVARRLPCDKRFYTGGVQDFDEKQDGQTLYPNDECAIALQNLDSREIAYCYSNTITTAESCAQHYEKLGFVRLREIPHKTANYDFLKFDTYPTRRWRDSEITSRW